MPVRARHYATFQTGPRAHQLPIQWVPGLFLGGKSGRSVELAIHHLAPRLKEEELYRYPPPRAFVACSREKWTFYLPTLYTVFQYIRKFYVILDVNGVCPWTLWIGLQYPYTMINCIPWNSKSGKVKRNARILACRPTWTYGRIWARR